MVSHHLEDAGSASNESLQEQEEENRCAIGEEELKDIEDSGIKMRDDSFDQEEI